jgi:BolA protein
MASGTVTALLEETLRTALAPVEHLEIRNESYKHKGPKDAESHFQVIIVSKLFDQKPLLQRHRMVNQACQSLLVGDGPIHALSIVAKTPEQWKAMEGQDIPGTPNCRGGGGK